MKDCNPARQHHPGKDIRRPHAWRRKTNPDRPRLKRSRS